MRADDFIKGWSVQDSQDLYNVAAWGSGYFTINGAGNVEVRPHRDASAAVDLKVLVEDLQRRGYDLPLLLRFSDILRSRVHEISDCFAHAIEEQRYQGGYQGVYPIKVNQQAQIVEELLDCGRQVHLGLEVGSKPEMLVALAILDDPEALLICNGYKDEEYVETALLAQKLGRRPILVVDRYRELEMVIRVARQHGIEPNLGIRAKLSARGAGRWAESGGSRSKFGLSATEIVEAARLLEREGMLHCLQLLHFHIGSQIPAIRVVLDALREASRIFVELHALGANMRYFDVGGGLGVDYDGSNTNFHSSMNYTIQEYANDVILTISEACESREVPHPVIVSESGRALVAHHAVLVFNILDMGEVVVRGEPQPPTEEDPQVVQSLYDTWKAISRRSLLEPYHDAVQLREDATQLFNLGHLDLEGRAAAERLFFACCTKLQRQISELPRVPEELLGLEKALADTFYCNFSVFQSMPDSWAVGQLFPLMPIHRLGERPNRRAILADLTCDSDGKVDQFIDLHDVKEVLDLHTPNGGPYYVGVFLVGAYQEILGDLHNLFGDTNAIHISLDGDRYRIDHVVVGDTVSEVLDYVEFDRRDLVRRVRHACENALLQQRVTLDETALLLRRYESGLNSYTYLSERRDSAGERPPETAGPGVRANEGSGPGQAAEATRHSGS